MVSRKVYDKRKSQGLCVRCGGPLGDSKTTRCISCKGPSKKKETPQKAEVSTIPDYSKERVAGYYDSVCSSCGESNLELLDIVTSSPDFLDTRSQAELRKHICDNLYTRAIIDPNYTLHCVKCFKKRSLQHAIDSVK